VTARVLYWTGLPLAGAMAACFGWMLAAGDLLLAGCSLLILAQAMSRLRELRAELAAEDRP
jgi:hypothetical protein